MNESIGESINLLISLWVKVEIDRWVIRGGKKGEGVIEVE